MSTQATVGGTVLATAVGVGTADSGSMLVAQSAQTLAFTGASHTMLMVTVAVLMIIAGLLLNGLSRRHSGFAVAGVPTVSIGSPPLRR